MKILITGAMGFIGSHFVDKILSQTDWEIILLEGLNYAAFPKRLENISVWEQEKHRVKYVRWDLRQEFNYWIEKEIGEVDYVLHLAAETHVDQSIKHPKTFFETNVIGTVNLLDWARLHPVKKFLYFSTDEVFGPIEKGEWKEEARHAPGNPYSAAKAGAEDACLAYANTYKLPIVITNTMNVMGQTQHPEKFIPMCIRKIINGETITIHSDPTKTIAGSRFYIHAKNAWEAIKFILTETDEFLSVKDPQSGRFNVVGDEEIDNLTLAKKIADIIGKELKYEMVDFHSSRPGHDIRYGLDGLKLKKLGFNYPKTFEETLRETVIWTLENKEWL